MRVKIRNSHKSEQHNPAPTPPHLPLPSPHPSSRRPINRSFSLTTLLIRCTNNIFHLLIMRESLPGITPLSICLFSWPPPPLLLLLPAASTHLLVSLLESCDITHFHQPGRTLLMLSWFGVFLCFVYCYFTLFPSVSPVTDCPDVFHLCLCVLNPVLLCVLSCCYCPVLNPVP